MQTNPRNNRTRGDSSKKHKKQGIEYEGNALNKQKQLMGKK